MPALQVTFPVVARKISGTREFRAKIPKDMEFIVKVGEKDSKDFSTTTPIDISAHEMEILDPMGKDSTMQVDDVLHLELQVPGEEPVIVEAHVRQVRKVRDSKGVQYCLGVQFDLANHSIRSSIEKIVGLVQRTYLRELSDLSEEYGVNYDEW